MSLVLNPLPVLKLSATVPVVPRLSEQVRDQIRDAMTRKKLSQRDVAGLLGWSQSRVAHLLTGRVVMGVDDLAEMCFALGIGVTEIVRDHGLEFCAEMTPTELRILERIRQLPTAVLDAVMVLLAVKQTTGPLDRHASPLKKTRNRRH